MHAAPRHGDTWGACRGTRGDTRGHQGGGGQPRGASGPPQREQSRGASPHRLVPGRRHHHTGFYGNREPRLPLLPLLCNSTAGQTPDPTAPHGTAQHPGTPSHHHPAGTQPGPVTLIATAPWGQHCPAPGDGAQPHHRASTEPRLLGSGSRCPTQPSAPIVGSAPWPHNPEPSPTAPQGPHAGSSLAARSPSPGGADQRDQHRERPRVARGGGGTGMLSFAVPSAQPRPPPCLCRLEGVKCHSCGVPGDGCAPRSCRRPFCRRGAGAASSRQLSEDLWSVQSRAGAQQPVLGRATPYPTTPTAARPCPRHLLGTAGCQVTPMPTGPTRPHHPSTAQGHAAAEQSRAVPGFDPGAEPPPSPGITQHESAF